MAHELKIDGKVYEASTAVAGAFGYTADYVSKLAREGKVLAQQVGRQWYIERESLTNFSHQASKQKIARKEELRKERKLERVARIQEQQPERSQLPHPSHAFAHAVIVFTVVAVGACLGLVAADEGVGYKEIEAGSIAVLTDFTSLGHEEVFSGEEQVALLGWLKDYWFKFGKEGSETTQTEPVDQNAAVETSETGLVLLDPATDENVVDAVRRMFSDPVEVDLTEGDSGYLKPVFKERTDESYRFLLVPVTQTNE